MSGATAKREIEWGDFQTPEALAAEVARTLAGIGPAPATIVEPTCGRGGLLAAAAERFPRARLVGYEIATRHLRGARAALAPHLDRCTLRRADFFATDWERELAGLPRPLLVLGNPPWVTSAAVGRVGGTNLPAKDNRDGLAGLAARTGRANFDVSEWIVARLIEASAPHAGTVAMLCKLAVARRLAARVFRAPRSTVRVRVYAIDARAAFGANVDACLLVAETGRARARRDAGVHATLGSPRPEVRWGWRDDRLVSDARAYDRHAHLLDAGGPRWRSGVKHDAAKVLELVSDGRRLRNGLGDVVDVEECARAPLLKGGDLARADADAAERELLLPQRQLDEDPRELAERAPRAWAYLRRHADRLAARRSSIYRGRPPMSVFGIGGYSFAPFKVALPCLYREPPVRVVGPRRRRAVLFDDTCAFLPLPRAAHARAAKRLLDSDPARALLGALSFPDAMRARSVDVLQQLDLARLAVELDEDPGPFEVEPLP